MKVKLHPMLNRPPAPGAALHLTAGTPLISIICYCPNESTNSSRALHPLFSQG